MYSPDPRRKRRSRAGALYVTALVLLFPGSGLPAVAQETADGPLVISTVDPPRTQASKAYDNVVRPRNISSDATYADEISGPVTRERAIRERRQMRRISTGPIADGGWSVAAAVLAVLVLLFLWLKFGGSSTLFSRPVRESRKAEAPPEMWNIAGNEADMDAATLLRHLAAMKDRREALARLLRHCLLSAGTDCDTCFARSDTEREAFARLPPAFKYHDALKALLHDAELAHYGGRPVSDAVFDRNLQVGRLLLIRQEGGRHAQ